MPILIESTGHVPVVLDVTSEAMATLYEYALRGVSERELCLVVAAVARELWRAQLTPGEALHAVERLLPPLPRDNSARAQACRTLHRLVLGWAEEAYWQCAADPGPGFGPNQPRLCS